VSDSWIAALINVTDLQHI